MKFMRLVFSTGEIFEIPATVIAEDRAKYYANSDCQKDNTLKFSEVYAKELDYSLNDNGELLDWASNNMNWSDVEPHAKKVEKVNFTCDYQDEWINSESKEFVEHD